MATLSSWVDEKSGAKGFLLPAKGLDIGLGDDERYWQWHWILLESQNCSIVEVPRLLEACPLEIKGTFDMSELTPNTKYEVAFMAMLKDPEGWDSPVVLRLDLPDGSHKFHDVPFRALPANQWVMLVAGDFTAHGDGKFAFSMLETTGEHKKGLVVKSILIRPVG